MSMAMALIMCYVFCAVGVKLNLPIDTLFIVAAIIVGGGCAGLGGSK